MEVAPGNKLLVHYLHFLQIVYIACNAHTVYTDYSVYTVQNIKTDKTLLKQEHICLKKIVWNIRTLNGLISC